MGHHYDVSNDFFALFLDPSMTYSCAIFSHGAQALASAQEAKLELVCRKLKLEPGQRVLDIGCGWGSFAIHAARCHGAHVVGVTLSSPQAKLARRLVADASLQDRIDIRVADYRELADEPFDAVASIGIRIELAWCRPSLVSADGAAASASPRLCFGSGMNPGGADFPLTVLA